MFKLNLKIAWRNLLKYRSYAAINIFGLALGLAGFIFIVLFANHEKSYDTWSPKLDNVYQVQEYTDFFPVESEFHWRDDVDRRFSTLFSTSIPQVKAVTMVEKEVEKGAAVVGKPAFLQAGLRRSDSLFFKVMPYTFKYGSSETAFIKPYSIVLNTKLASTYFGNVNPLGQTIILSDRGKGSELHYTVTGVIEEPETSSILNFSAVYIDDGRDFRFGAKFDPTGSTEMYALTGEIKALSHFNNRLQSGYLPLKDKHLKQFNESLTERIKAGNRPLIRFVKMADVHQNPIVGKSWKEKLRPVVLLSTLLLLISIINFINLSTAQATSRAKEVGIKKVIGVQKNTLVTQILTETFIQCLISLFVGLFIIELSLPVLNEYFSLNLSVVNGGLKLLFQLLLITIMVALLTGAYPALFLSSYQPKEVLKGNFFASAKGSFVRKGLVGLQFVVTISFIIGILLVAHQVNYLQTRDQGFTKNGLLNVRAKFPYGKQEYNRLKAVDGVKFVGYCAGVIGTNQPSGSNFKYKNESKALSAIGLNLEGLKALDARLLAGRFFSDAISQDTIGNVMINEAAAKLLSGNVVGENLMVNDTIPLKIIGVIKDIQVSGFEEPVAPSVYIIQSHVTDRKIGTYYTQSTLIKFEPGKLKRVIAELEAIFQERNNFYPLKYSFVDDDLAKVLIDHKRFEKMVALFATVSLMLSLFGLFALAAFITKQRTKEIAIRKVLGAAQADILLMLNRGYVWIILIANAIAFPLAYLLMNKWLSNFAYRITVTPLPFMLAFLASVGITILTVSLQARKTIKANPVNALKYE